MGKKATEDQMSELHSSLALVLAEQLKNPEVSPALLNVARQFLKDNHIDSVIEPGNPLDILAEAELPFQNVEPIRKERKAN